LLMAALTALLIFFVLLLKGFFGFGKSHQNLNAQTSSAAVSHDLVTLGKSGFSNIRDLKDSKIEDLAGVQKLEMNDLKDSKVEVPEVNLKESTSHVPAVVTLGHGWKKINKHTKKNRLAEETQMANDRPTDFNIEVPSVVKLGHGWKKINKHTKNNLDEEMRVENDQQTGLNIEVPDVVNLGHGWKKINKHTKSNNLAEEMQVENEQPTGRNIEVPNIVNLGHGWKKINKSHKKKNKLDEEMQVEDENVQDTIEVSDIDQPAAIEGKEDSVKN